MALHFDQILAESLNRIQVDRKSGQDRLETRKDTFF